MHLPVVTITRDDALPGGRNRENPARSGKGRHTCSNYQKAPDRSYSWGVLGRTRTAGFNIVSSADRYHCRRNTILLDLHAGSSGIGSDRGTSSRSYAWATQQD